MKISGSKNLSESIAQLEQDKFVAQLSGNTRAVKLIDNCLRRLKNMKSMKAK